MNWTKNKTKNRAAAAGLYLQEHRKRIAGRTAGIVTGLIKLCIIVGISFIVLASVFGIVSKAFMDIEDFYNPLVYMIPMNFTWENMEYALKYMDYFHSLLITAGFCVLIMGIQLIICALIGYGFARYKFPGGNLLFGLVVLTIIIPANTMMTPMYIQFRYFNPFGLLKGDGYNLINTVWPMVLLTATGMGLRSGLFIFIYRQFFRGLPKEFEESAFIDGAGPMRTFFKVMLPNARPAIIIVALFSFVWQYNDMFYAGILMSSRGLLSTKLNGLFDTVSQIQWITDRNQITLIVDAGVVLTIVPLILLYLFLQRYFMEGIERSGIVG